MLECIVTGLDRQIPNSINVFQNDIIHQTLELGAPQRTEYRAGEDDPVFGEAGSGKPFCFDLPNTPEKADFFPVRDGSDKDDPDGGIG